MRSIQAIGTKVYAIVIQTPQEVTPSGIILPDNVLEEPQRCCKVVSVGEAVTTIKEGDIIVIHPRGGMAVMFNREQACVILNYDEIYGVLTTGE
jgi:co-chaperonin GroES (HSP10)